MPVRSGMATTSTDAVSFALFGSLRADETNSVIVNVPDRDGRTWIEAVAVAPFASPPTVHSTRYVVGTKSRKRSAGGPLGVTHEVLIPLSVRAIGMLRSIRVPVVASGPRFLAEAVSVTVAPAGTVVGAAVRAADRSAVAQGGANPRPCIAGEPAIARRLETAAVVLSRSNTVPPILLPIR